MWCTCSTDFVRRQIERCECLCWIIHMHMKWLNGELILLYSAVIHWLNVVLLHRRYYSSTDRAWWVSMLNYTYAYEMDEWRTNLTVFCCNAFAKCCAAASPIWFHDRSTVVSVYCNYTYAYEMNEWRTNLTVLCCNALPKCCAPSALIPLFRRSSMVSVYVELYICIWDGSMENWSYCILL
jgi:hypothetical protein